MKGHLDYTLKVFRIIVDGNRVCGSSRSTKCPKIGLVGCLSKKVFPPWREGRSDGGRGRKLVYPEKTLGYPCKKSVMSHTECSETRSQCQATLVGCFGGKVLPPRGDFAL